MSAKNVYYRKNSEGEFVECVPRLRPPTKKDRNEFERYAAKVRGKLIARLDDLCHKKVLPIVEEMNIEWSDWINLLQMIQLALFPEEFEDKDCGNEGLIPKRGLGSISNQQMLAFLATL
jgi:hypothetical protein